MNRPGPKTWLRRLLILNAAALAACGGKDAPPPIASRQSVTMNEDQAHSGFVHATTKTDGALRYTLAAVPANGTATVDTTTGAFTYTPKADFFGVDTFQFTATDGHLKSAPATVSIQVDNVNDAPILMPIPDHINSPDSREQSYLLNIIDVDGDVSVVTAISDDPAVGSVTTDSVAKSISITQENRGQTKILVTVADAQFSASQSFGYTVGDVTKVREISAGLSTGEAILLQNTTEKPIRIRLEHNGVPTFESNAEIVEFVRTMKDDFEGEPFQRKLWRFVRDSTYHMVPLTLERWFHDPWAVIGSQGWGFCSHVAATYVLLAREAGYEARIWGLTGHVVAEIRIGDRWEMYDPDLAVYYMNHENRTASVAELVADSSLITTPVNHFNLAGQEMPYSAMIANFYATPANNFVGEHVFLGEPSAQYRTLEIPGGATLKYPGRWTDEVIGADGDAPYAVPYYLQGKLTTLAGWTGELGLPWMIWEIRGTGRVSVLGQEYQIGSSELNALLKSPGQPVDSINVIESTADVEVIFFVNAMRYALTPKNLVRVTALDAWAINVSKVQLSSGAHVNNAAASRYRKPTF